MFAAGLVLGALPAVAHADGHQVTYTITATGNLTGQVRFMNTDPPSQAAFDANSSQYMNTVQAAFSAGAPVVYTATLANPNQWAYVNASGGCHWPDCGSGATPQLQLPDRRRRPGRGDAERHHRRDVFDAPLVNASGLAYPRSGAEKVSHCFGSPV